MVPKNADGWCHCERLRAPKPAVRRPALQPRGLSQRSRKDPIGKACISGIASNRRSTGQSHQPKASMRLTISPVETHAQPARRNAGDDFEGHDIACYHGIGADDGAVADRHARHDHRAVTDPDIMAYRDALCAPPFTESIVHAQIAEEFVRPVVDLVAGDPLDRMLQRVDARVGGDRAELSDRRVDRLGVPLEIGKVADADLAQDHPLADHRVAPEPAGFHLRRRVGARLGTLEAQVRIDFHQRALRGSRTSGKSAP